MKGLFVSVAVVFASFLSGCATSVVSKSPSKFAEIDQLILENKPNEALEKISAMEADRSSKDPQLTYRKGIASLQIDDNLMAAAAFKEIENNEGLDAQKRKISVPAYLAIVYHRFNQLELAHQYMSRVESEMQLYNDDPHAINILQKTYADLTYIPHADLDATNFKMVFESYKLMTDLIVRGIQAKNPNWSPVVMQNVRAYMGEAVGFLRNYEIKDPFDPSAAAALAIRQKSQMASELSDWVMNVKKQVTITLATEKQFVDDLNEFNIVLQKWIYQTGGYTPETNPKKKKSK